MSSLFFALCVASFVVTAVYLALPWLLSLRGVTMQRRGPFGATLVFESPDDDGTIVRLLNVDGTFQSATYLSDDLWSELVCVYHREMVHVIDEMGDVHEVLVIGGGGYSLPKYLVTHTQRMLVTVVEIDPTMTAVARESFFLDRAEEHAAGRLTIVHADGWQLLRDSTRRFDVIVNDAFKGNRPLGALATDEGARLISEHLTEGGAYLANVRCPLEGRRSAPLREVEEAFGAQFTHVSVIPERPEEPTKPGNNVLVATNRELSLD
ncbi:MAG: fused MFS/spermidine synthase [Atopobiaceae bacterium]|nr:fused MFS/spermidine synthase [Atopobiaceae bacterium]